MSLSPWLYVVLLGLVCLVYAQLLPRKETAPSGDMMKELEQSMELFASDMEEQNESLLKLFSDTKHDYEGHLTKLSGRLEQLEKQNQLLVQELSRPRAPEPQQLTVPDPVAANGCDGDPASAEKALAPSAAEGLASGSGKAEPEATARSPLLMNVKERYAELFRLHTQSKSVEYIAKKLGMNKGEVHLIIQLAKQEEKAHV